MNDYCVYAYVFDDGMTYVGLTRQKPSRRDYLHRYPRSSESKRSPVLAKCVSESLPFPDMLVLYDGLTEQEAQRTEHILHGSVPRHLRINRKKTGIGTGGLGTPRPKTHRRTSEEIAEAKRAIQKKYASLHEEKIREYYRSYYLKNRKRKSETGKAYRKAHQDEVRSKNKKYAEKNRTALNAKARERYHRHHPDAKYRFSKPRVR